MSLHTLSRALIGITLLGAAALLPIGIGAIASESARPLRMNAADLNAVHDATSASFDKNCLKCHGDVMKRRTLDRKIKDAHAAMVPFAPGYKAGATNEACVSCHEKVDLVQRSAAQLRKNVSTTTCTACHSMSGPASKKFYAN